MDTIRAKELEALRSRGVAYVVRRCGGLSWQDAEDVVGEVVLKLWCYEGETDNLAATFLTACRNQAIDLIRKREAERRRQARLEQAALPSCCHVEHLDARETLRGIIDTLPQLSERQGEAVSMKVAGYTVPEIAERTGHSLPSASKAVYGGFERLRALEVLS